MLKNIFHRLVLVLERYSVSVADHDQDGTTENGKRRTEDGMMEDGALEYWSIGVLGLALNKSALVTGYAAN
jgi:hypothetical protein